MQTFKIKDKEIALDDSKLYLDFFVSDGQYELVQLNMAGILNMLQNKTADEKEIEYFVYLERWNVDVPRKKFYRDLKRTGVGVLSQEYFFEDREDSDQILENLQ